MNLMGLKDFFQQMKLPTKNGKSNPNHEFKAPVWESVFLLEMVNLEGSPKYELKHQLSIGSEIGNIVIADPSLSPRHCTFYLQQDVVSLIDHGSIQGTLINGIKLSAGKFIILEESDKIQVGDLEIKIIKENRAIESSEDEALAEDEDDVTDGDEELEDEIEEPQKKSFLNFSFFKKKDSSAVASKKPVQNNSKSFSVGSVEKAANTLPRSFAIFGDMLIAASLHAIFTPFDDYKAYQDFIPGFIGELLGQDLSTMWDAFLQDQPAIAELLKDIMSEGTKSFPLVDIFINFAVLRFVTTLILGVSISEFILGMKSIGNAIWARVGGAMRVLIGLVTGPLIVFDVPALVSRRTFKEFITFTHVSLRGKLAFIALALIYIPTCIALFLISPMFQGLDFPSPVNFSDRIPSVQTGKAPQESGEVTPLKSMRSKVLGIDLDVDETQVFSYVDLRFQTEGKKKVATPVISFYFLGSDREAQLSVDKRFDFQELLSIAIKGNYFLHEKYPEMSKFLYDASNVNKNFSLKMSAREELQFTTEMIDLLKVSFDLSVDNFIETMETHTLMLKSLIEFKSSLLALVPSQFDRVDLVRFGNQISLRFSYMSGKRPYDLIIPLRKGQGIIYRIAYDKANQLNDLKDSLYKVHLSQIDWKQSKSDEMFSADGAMDTLKIYDFMNSISERKNLNDDGFRNLYGYYHQLGRLILMNPTPRPELEVNYSQAIGRVYEALKSYIGNPKYDDYQNSLMTLEKSFQDLMSAFKDKNMTYFDSSF